MPLAIDRPVPIGRESPGTVTITYEEEFTPTLQRTAGDQTQCDQRRQSVDSSVQDVKVCTVQASIDKFFISDPAYDWAKMEIIKQRFSVAMQRVVAAMQKTKNNELYICNELATTKREFSNEFHQQLTAF